MFQQWILMLFAMLSEAISARRDTKMRFLKAQLAMYRTRLLGNRVILSPEERKLLVELGKSLDHCVHDVIEIVTVKTYKRWLREKAVGKEPGRVGRPRLTDSLRRLITRMAKENVGWGVRRIVGELKKLALRTSRSTVRRVLIDEGVLPDPNRHAPKGVMTPWRIFLQAHMNVMVACDFFCKNIWTPLGKRQAFSLMFIHLGTRKVFVSPGTYHPTEQWMLQQARNVTMWLEDEGLELKYLIRDRDGKYAESFDAWFERFGRIVKAPFQSPIANAFAESWIGSLKRECLNHFVCFSLRHLDYIVHTYVNYYNVDRPHQRMGNLVLGENQPPDELPPPDTVGCISHLGGLLNSYHRKAA